MIEVPAKAETALQAVLAGTAGWVSLTHTARETGCAKVTLAGRAFELGLRVVKSHGRYGACVFR